MSGLASSLSNANNYALGCVMDGVPTNCTLVGQMIARDQAKELGVVGVALTEVARVMTSFTAVGIEIRDIPDVVPNPPTKELPNGRGFIVSFGASEVWTQFIIAPGLQQTFEQNPQNPTQQPIDPRSIPHSIERGPSAAQKKTHCCKERKNC